MFTGLVAGVGRLQSRQQRDGDARLRIDVGTLPWPMQGSDAVRPGESVAVNGCCLTVIEPDAAGFSADASNETLALTTLGTLPTGAPLNLERALLPTDRLGGHLVSGHVDGVALASQCWPDARAVRWRFEPQDASLLRYVARKGSICVDGTSLTVNAVDATGFEVALIPHTVAHTAFRVLQVGGRVNVEMDLLARHVERLLAATRG